MLNNPTTLTDPSGLGPPQCTPQNYNCGRSYPVCRSEACGGWAGLGIIPQSWNPFDILQLATTPTAFGFAYPSNLPEGVYSLAQLENSGYGSGLSYPIYGNLSAAGLLDYVNMYNTPSSTSEPPTMQRPQTPNEKIGSWTQSHVCGGGVFGYAGLATEVKGAEGFAGVLAEWDSKTGGTLSFLGEAGTPRVSTGVSANTSQVQPLLFFPLTAWGGGVVFESGVGFYVGTPSYGAGAYANVSVSPGCQP